MCPATIYLRHSPFLMTAWPDFPSALFAVSQRLKISFIWKRWKCKIQNQRGRASGWHCNKELNLSQMSFFLISSWFVHHCGFVIKPLWVDFLLHVEHCALWPLWCIYPVSRKSSANTCLMNHTTQSALRTSHRTAWLCCYLKRISMPRWILWPPLCKTASR